MHTGCKHLAEAAGAQPTPERDLVPSEKRPYKYQRVTAPRVEVYRPRPGPGPSRFQGQFVDQLYKLYEYTSFTPAGCMHAF